MNFSEIITENSGNLNWVPSDYVKSLLPFFYKDALIRSGISRTANNHGDTPHSSSTTFKCFTSISHTDLCDTVAQTSSLQLHF